MHQRLNKAVEEIRKLFDVVKGSLKDMEEEEKVNIVSYFPTFLSNIILYCKFLARFLLTQYFVID